MQCANQMSPYLSSLTQPPEFILQTLESDLCAKHDIQLDIVRLDLVDETISGNKWFKLKHNLSTARELNYKRVLSYGGCHSNHLHALAAAGKRFGFETIGVVRGDEPKNYSATLQDLLEYGMVLKFISRGSYRNKNMEGLISALKKEFGEFFLIPEGGSNLLGVKGCAEMVSPLWDQPATKIDYLVLGCGTGATLAGAVVGAGGRCKVLGISALKGADYLNDNVLSLISSFNLSQGCADLPLGEWRIIHDYHFGGFAKIKPELVQFMDTFSIDTGIPIEPVYVGKTLFAVYDLIKTGQIPPGARIVVIHTGGLQGVRGMKLQMQKQRDRILKDSAQHP